MAEWLDAARGELIGSVRFRRRKWCSSNTGSNPVLTTKRYNKVNMKAIAITMAMLILTSCGVTKKKANKQTPKHKVEWVNE